MILTKDTLGSSLEIILPPDTDMDKFKSIFSNLSFSLIPEAQSIQFGLGAAVSKKSNSNLVVMPKRVEISLEPHRKNEIPALALVYDVVFQSIAIFSLINI